MASTERHPRPNTSDGIALSGTSRTGPAGRRPYLKPRVLYTETLEAVAADCSVPGGKGDPTCIVGFS